MNPDCLAGSRGRPVRIALVHAIDGSVQDINEFALRGVIGIDTVNLCIGILASWSRRRTDPSICADNQDMIPERNALRLAEVSDLLRGLIVFRQLVPVPVYKINNIGINSGPFPFHMDVQGM